MRVDKESTYRITGLTEYEKDVLVQTIRHRYVDMLNDDPDYETLNRLLVGLCHA